LRGQVRYLVRLGVGARFGTMELGDRLGGGGDLEAISLSVWLLSSPSTH